MLISIHSSIASRHVLVPDHNRGGDAPARLRHALTLIEMLVGMAITLVMMAAVVNLFANISQGVKNRRATMEVSANLRIARARLYNDLAGATCLKYPKNTHAVMPKPDSNNMPDGYFEYVEGEYSDENPSDLMDGDNDPPNGEYELDYATSLVPSAGDPQIVVPYNSSRTPSTGDVTNGGGLGDYDDILAMTVESQTERFRGKGRGLRPGGNPSIAADWIDMPISSPLAEVIWFSIENPVDRSQGEPGMRKIYRRVVLISPWYGTETRTIGASTVTGSDPLLDLSGIVHSDPQEEHRRLLVALKEFQGKYDISVRLENKRLVPNSLADLARREHRFAHSPNNTSAAPNIAHYPHHFPYDVDSPNFTETPDEDDSSLQPLGEIQFPQVYPAAIHAAVFANREGERGGEDLVLNEVLAFDVQVFDPGAPLYTYQGTIVPPSSSQAFLTAATTLPPATSITGFGAYVDLGWNNALNYNYLTNILPAIPTAPAPLFQEERRMGWHPSIAPPLANYWNLRGTPAVYDTWTTHYETDQSNQEAAPFYLNMTPSPPPWATWQIGTPDGSGGYIGGTDQGANGLDDDGLNGPDDPLERETSPPYPYPLYGVQVKLRVYEPESRQIKETTVTRNLAK